MVGEEKSHADSPLVPMQTWERGKGRDSPHTSTPPRTPLWPESPEAWRQRLPGPQAANARPNWVLAESPEPRVWATHCLWMAPALTKLRRELNQFSIACVWVLIWRAQMEFFMQRGAKLPRTPGEGVLKPYSPTLLPRRISLPGKGNRYFEGVF